MTNFDLIKEFNNGATRGVASHLYIKGNELVNYSTVIAWRDANGGIHLNKRKYSTTTSKIQSKIACYCNVVEEYDGEPCYYWNYGYCGAPQIKAREVYGE